MNSEPHSEAVTAFFQTGTLLRYSKGEVIIQANQEPDGVYLIVKGYIKVYSISESGEENIHIIYGRDELFPVLWAFRDVYKDIFCEAIDDVAVWRVTRSALIDFAKRDVDTTFGLLNTVAEQFAAFAFRVDNLEYKQTTERIIYRLLFLASRFGTRQDNHATINAPITHQILADSLNLSRESVSREFKKLERRGLVHKVNGKITLDDVVELCRMLGDPPKLHEWRLFRG